MFLTKIDLDPSRRLARKYLASPQVMHAVIMKAAQSGGPNPSGRVLWRVDRSMASTRLFLLSPDRPDCSQIVTDAGLSMTQAVSLDYNPFLNKLESGQTWVFRLTANPSRSVSNGIGKRGKLHGHVTVEQQRQWLIERADRLGFALNTVNRESPDESTYSVTVTQRSRPVFGRDNPHNHVRDRVTINKTVYEGLLRVTDVEVFRNSLTAGIGRSKAYGCGLMTLAKVRES
ncbi:type I-E CRISPR-associated protein Cas6/Cse3/CasE [Schaalia vaccimaxillae]|uniref:type I-E CRISPR-associated protein Cas6/Cse3/CasE n=1 Tax=Schaalia vaccimaxillae TaxID=183916 RepID=UPI0003B5B10D|nr:type I-E CRISPR-associated protein Cas6/Cse3/CasE [Schaalia vaccimaxillae]